jgi:hypothetical protein
MQLERIACVALAVLGLGLPPAHGDDYPTREAPAPIRWCA